MSIEFGVRINHSGPGRNGQDAQSGSRRQQHQQKLKALIAALDDGDLVEAKVNYRLLLAFSPAMQHSRFSRVGEALASANMGLAKRVIEEIYGQSQAIFKASLQKLQPHSEMRLSSRKNFGLLADYSA